MVPQTGGTQCYRSASRTVHRCALPLQCRSSEGALNVCRLSQKPAKQQKSRGACAASCRGVVKFHTARHLHCSAPSTLHAWLDSWDASGRMGSVCVRCPGELKISLKREHTRTDRHAHTHARYLSWVFITNGARTDSEAQGAKTKGAHNTKYVVRWCSFHACAIRHRGRASGW